MVQRREIWVLHIKLRRNAMALWTLAVMQTMSNARVSGMERCLPSLLPMGAHVSAAALEKHLEGLQPRLTPQDQQFLLQV